MNKANIVLYDDLVIIDETEAYYKDSGHLTNIAVNCLRTTPGAEYAEVYVNGKLKAKYTLTNKGKPKKMSTHPNWGGRRPGAGSTPKGEKAMRNKVSFRVDDEMLEFLNRLLSKKGEYIRQAIREKRDKEKGSQ